VFNSDKYISYKSGELWKSFRFSTETDEVEETFTVGDYWLLIIYFTLQKSWDLLRKATSHVESPEVKKRRIKELEKKLSNIGYYETPEKILMLFGTFSDMDLNEATDWFFDGVDY
jgi:hypothetical protein